MKDGSLQDGRYRKTRRMILVRGLLAPLIALMLVCGVLVYYFASYAGQQVKATLVRIASDHRHLVDRFLAERAADLQFAAAAGSMEDLSARAGLRELFRNLQAESEAFFDLGVFDEAGNHLQYVGPYELAGKSYAEASWFKEVREKGLYISDVFLGYRKIPHFIIAVRRRQGERTWYLRATIDTLAFDHLVEGIRVGDTGEAYVVNRQGVFQTKRRSGGELMQSDPDFSLYQIDEQAIACFCAGEYPGRRYLYTTGPLEQTDWVLVVRQQVSDAYGPVLRAVLVAVGVILLGGAGVVGMAYVLASGLAHRLTLADVEKQQMTTQLIVAGKLAEVGEMSAGLAHEINNPLQVIKAEHTMIEDILSDIEEDGGPPDPERFRVLKDSLAQIDVQVQRCKRITQELLRFARRTEPSTQAVQLQEFLPQVAGMVEHMARVSNVRIVYELAADLPPIVSDPGQLQQVFLNLLNNALYALKGRDQGEIRIRAEVDGAYVDVAVADNGSGIPPEDMEKIFLPFYTTKPVGQGTGLGLSTSYGIVEGLGGEITVASQLNAGTVFTVRLPLVSAGESQKIG